MNSRASTRTRFSILPVFIALLFNVIAPVASIAVPDAAPEPFAAPQIAVAADAPDQVNFTLEGCRLENGDFIEASLTCTEPGYTTGNLGKEWAELDRVPHRLTATNNNGLQTYDIKISADYLRTGTIGYDLISVPTLKSGPCTFTTSAQTVEAGQAGGADSTISRTLTITQPAGSTCVFDYNMRLALGSSGYSGSSLHAYLLAEGVGEKRVPLPVDKDFPAQELRKTMTATQGQAYTWSVSKSSDPASLNFANTCATTAGARSANVNVTVTWTRSGPTASGSTTVTTQVYAKNPSERTIQVSVTDRIYEGAGQTVLLDTASAGPVSVPANTESLILTHTFNYPSTGTATTFNDVATATYTDPINPDVTIPGNTTATASATTAAAGGSPTNATAVITDSESITGTGLTFSVAAPSSGAFTAGYLFGTQTTGPVGWSSGVVSGSGSVTFNKTVQVDQARITSGTLTDTATVTSADGQQTLATSAPLNIGITSGAQVSLTINKTIPSDALESGESVTFDFEVYAGATATGTPVATPSITFTFGGDVSKSVVVSGLAPGQYTVHEVPEAGWDTLSDETDTMNLPDCEGSLTFGNTDQRPNPSVLKEAVLSPIVAGDSAGFDITVSGGGTGSATNVTLTDVVPAGHTWTVTGASVGDCTDPNPADTGLVLSGGQTLTCNFGTMSSTTPDKTITITTTSTAADCPSISNTARITATGDVSTTNNESTATISVLCPNPSVLKEAVLSPIVAGDSAGFDITVSGGGTGSATNVTLTDVVPAGHTWTVTGASVGDCTDPNPADTGLVLSGGQTLTCNFGTMSSTTPDKTITITTTSTAADCPSISNTARITATGDVSTTNNESTATISVLCPNVSVTKSASTLTVLAPGSLTYTITGTNTGSGEARGVVITDNLDDDLVITSATFNVDPSTAGETTCTWTTTGDKNQVTCNIGTLAASDGNTDGAEPDAVRVTINVTVPTAACPSVTNSASIQSSNEPSSATSNNQSNVVVVAVSCPDVSVDKSVSSPIVVLGSSATFTITASGGTRGTTSDVTLTDTVPTGFTWTVGGANIGSCKVGATTLAAGSTVTGGQTIACNFGPLGANQTRVITVSATPAAANCAAAISNTAVVAADGDTDTTNNSDTAVFTVRCPTLVIDKVASTETITISGPNDALVATPSVVTWTLSYTLTNGPVTGAVITDPVPTGFTFLDAANGGTFASGTVTWNLGTLTTSGSVTFRTTVNPATISRTGPTVNTATIDSNETAPDTGQDSVTVVVVPPVLAGNPPPPPAPAPVLPNTATGIGLDGKPITVPLELLVAFFIGSLGAMTLANVKARSRRR